MKKGTIITIAVIVVVALAAVLGVTVFGGNKPADNTPTVPQGPSIIDPQVTADTLGAKQWAAFKAAVEANANATANELAGKLSEGITEFFCMAQPLEQNTEYFPGFDNYKITGFKSASAYMPMIGSIAFVGYVFELEDGTDAATFVNSLKENCNPRWNICVTAEQTVVGAIDNRIFFLMCPENISVEGGDDMDNEGLYDDLG
jgi:FlaG/FlaF family flagellin (archaellin)